MSVVMFINPIAYEAPSELTRPATNRAMSGIAVRYRSYTAQLSQCYYSLTIFENREGYATVIDRLFMFICVQDN